MLDRVHALEQFEQHGAADSELGKLNSAPRSTSCERATSCCGSSTTAGRNRRKPILRRRDVPPFASGRLSRSAGPPPRARQPPRRHGRRPRRATGRRSRPWPTKSCSCASMSMPAAAKRSSGRPRPSIASWLPPDQYHDRNRRRIRRSSRTGDGPPAAGFDGLVLEESQAALPSGDEVADCAGRRPLPSRLDRVFPADDARRRRLSWLACDCLAAWMPDLNLPALDDDRAAAALAAARRRPPLAGRTATRALARCHARALHLAATADDRPRSARANRSSQRQPDRRCNTSRAGRRSWRCEFKRCLACSKRRASPAAGFPC